VVTAPITATSPLVIKGFFHEPSSTISYVVSDMSMRRCVVIDPVLDYDAKSGRTGTIFADRLTAYLRNHDLAIDWILETHAHADHLSAAQVLKQRFDAPVAIGEHIRLVQRAMKRLFNLGDDFTPDGRQFDRLLRDGEELAVGTGSLRVLHTPGHTQACVTYAGDGYAFVGDTVFMPDYGTARADFPGGSASELYNSIRRLYELPPQTILYTCHDYPPDGRPVTWQSTVAEQRAGNIHLRDGVSHDEFVRLRETRDWDLPLPALMLHALQVNIRAGSMPPAEENGISYLKIPVNVLR
jgi:glyoxylase-like metal-dependent hydrolase (beta-lactamase superfamily II)